MPGLYTIPRRAPGTIITALIYNSDHQNHVDGRTASLMQSLGASASQMGFVEDPFPNSVESLPTNLAGEIARLRFDIAALKTSLSGGTSVAWYDALGSPGFAAIGARVVRPAFSSQSIPDSFVTAITFASATANFNSGVWVNGSPTRFTAPVTGKYMAACSVLWAAGVGAGRRQIEIGVNGVTGTSAFLSNLTSAGVAQYQAVSGLLNLTATDFVEFFAFQDSGFALNLVSDSEVSRSISGSLIYFGS